MQDIIYLGVQFSPVGKSYHFSAPADAEINLGTFVLVNTARGRQLGCVIDLDVQSPVNPEEIQPIERIATSKDLEVRDALRLKETEAVEQVRKFLDKSRFTGVKAIHAEYSFDSTRLTLFLNYEPDSGFDIKGFLREVSHLFKDVRIEVRQIGPRDVAKQFSGLGACGIEKRCCSRFLTEFSSISIKMAKSQDISLTPEEITGICGRLRCCLSYEYSTYEEALKNLPKRKKVIQTPLGEGKVVQVMPMCDSVMVDLPEVGSRKFTREELESGVMHENKPPIAETLVAPMEESEDVQFVRIDQRPRQTEESHHRQPHHEQRPGQNGRPESTTKNDRPRYEQKRDQKQQNSQGKPGTDRPKSEQRRKDYQKPNRPRQDNLTQKQAKPEDQTNPQSPARPSGASHRRRRR